MSEEQQTEINSAENEGDRIQSETISELDRADQIAERQKRENDRREELLVREEALAARRAVGGGSEAGKPAEKEEESPKDYADKVMKGEIELK